MTDNPITHMHADEREGFECALCDNPIPYVMEEIVVPTRVLLNDEAILPLYVCGDCWEEAYEKADPGDVMVSALVCTIHTHA